VLAWNRSLSASYNGHSGRIRTYTECQLCQITYVQCSHAKHRRSGVWSAANSSASSCVITKSSALNDVICLHAVSTDAHRRMRPSSKSRLRYTRVGYDQNPPRGSDRIRSTGYCQFSNFRFKSVATLGGPPGILTRGQSPGGLYVCLRCSVRNPLIYFSWTSINALSIQFSFCVTRARSDALFLNS